MMLPILISVSVTPGSYFFWASALLPPAASRMRAVENAANRRVTKDISLLPVEIDQCVRRETSSGLLPDIEYPASRPVDIDERCLARAFDAVRDQSMLLTIILRCWFGTLSAEGKVARRLRAFARSVGNAPINAPLPILTIS